MIKKGKQVQILCGKDKGKKGEVIEILKSESKEERAKIGTKRREEEKKIKDIKLVFENNSTF